MNPSHSHLLQMQALREALERSARATLLAEEHTVRALSDLQTERNRTRELERALSKSNQRYAELLSENKRLRNLVGQACQDRQDMSAELKALLKELRDTGPDPLDPPAVAQQPDQQRQRNAA